MRGTSSMFTEAAGQLMWKVLQHQITNKTLLRAKLDEYRSGTYQGTLQIELLPLRQSLDDHRTRQPVASIEE